MRPARPENQYRFCYAHTCSLCITSTPNWGDLQTFRSSVYLGSMNVLQGLHYPHNIPLWWRTAFLDWVARSLHFHASLASPPAPCPTPALNSGQTLCAFPSFAYGTYLEFAQESLSMYRYLSLYLPECYFAVRHICLQCSWCDYFTCNRLAHIVLHAVESDRLETHCILMYIYGAKRASEGGPEMS